MPKFKVGQYVHRINGTAVHPTVYMVMGVEPYYVWLQETAGSKPFKVYSGKVQHV